MRFLQALRVVTLVEAVSYLVLVGVAMPLKYWWGEPLAVRIFGMVHGVLFLLMLWLLLRARFEAKWGMDRLWLVFVASLFPVWPFFVDRRLRAWVDATPAV